MMGWLLALLALAVQDTPRASGGVLLPEQAVYDVQRYSLALDVDPVRRAIEGTLKMSAIATAEAPRIALDLDDHLQVRGVTGSRELDWNFTDRRIWVDFAAPLHAGESFDVTVAYGGEPRVAPNPPWDGGFTWAETADGRPWIATSCQGEGADLWWPCKDHPSDKPNGMDLDITVPEGLVCASNGKLLGSLISDGKTTWRWKLDSPISNYAVAVNVAPYEVLRTSWTSVAGGEVPFELYALPESVDQARAHLPELVEQMRFFERVLGPYPFRAEKYGVVETPHLGMEHQTIIAYGYGYKHDAYGYDWLHHHEASHEWWGNLVTCADWKDMWIHEGFGTYMQALYVEEKNGRDGERGLVRWLAQTGANLANRRPVAPRETRDSKEIYFDRIGNPDNDIYSKGALVLHTLRWHLGDDKFFEAFRRFAYPDDAHRDATDGSQVRLVDTEDFRRVCEDVAKEDLGWFFDVYLRQPELPRLKTSWRPLPSAPGGPGGGQLRLEWELPTGGAFPLKVPVRIGPPDQRQIITLVAGPDQVYELAGAEPEIDPELWLLRAR